VTLAFSLAMAAVLGATGLFVYLRLGAELDATIRDSLHARAGDVSALIAHAGNSRGRSGRSILTDRGETFAEILDSSGRVVDSTPGVHGEPLLRGLDLQRALRGSVFLDRQAVGGEDGAIRLLATPVRAQGERRVVVVSAPLEDRKDALSNLGRLLLIGGPVALLLASLGGYGAAAAALRPVEQMRRRAAEIQAADPGARLPVPPIRDEIGRLGDTLNEMLERLEGAFARERTFVTDASHELRTPLTVLKAELELGLLRGRSNEELVAAMRSAAEETDRVVQLAEDLLVIARADDGQLPVRGGEVAVRELLGSVRDRFARRAAEVGAELDVSVPHGLVVVADRFRLEQAVGNLVDNALSHGGKRIVLSATEVADRIELHVTDDGPGFPQAFISSAFERFARADAGRGRGGTGLGLAIVAAIADAHGGSVGARNQEAGGADVWLGLPRTGVGRHGAADAISSRAHSTLAQSPP
jgi:signal transduction histidine kinase